MEEVKEENKALLHEESVDIPIKKYSNFIDYARDLPAQKIIKTNCKLCVSAFRKEAEELFANGKSANNVYKFLISKGEDVSPGPVRNHLMKHYNQPLMEEQIKGYAEDLERISAIEVSTHKRLTTYRDMLEKEIIAVSSSISTSNIDVARKSQEMLLKLIHESQLLEEKIRELEARYEPMDIFIENFKRITEEQINSLRTQEAKEALLTMLEQMQKIQSQIEGKK